MVCYRVLSRGAIMKLKGVMLGSENSKVLGEFYTKILGKPGWQQDDWYGFEAEGSLMIGPHSEVKGSNTSPGRIIVSFETSDVQKEFKRIEALDAKVIAK